MNTRSPLILGRADVRECGTLWHGSPAPREPITFAIQGAAIRQVREADADMLHRAMLRCNASQPHLAYARIAGKRLGYVVEGPVDARGHTEILTYGWIARPGDTLNDLGFPLNLPPGNAWIYDCATIPQARANGLYSALLRAMRMAMPELGLEHAWIGTAPRNWASQRGIARAGFHKMLDQDWSASIPAAYGTPGASEELLSALSAAFDDLGEYRIVLNHGIPWIEGIAPARTAAGVKLFQEVYGEQIHWSTSASANAVILMCDGQSVQVDATASFEELAAALDRIAPDLPWLVSPGDAGRS